MAKLERSAAADVSVHTKRYRHDIGTAYRSTGTVWQTLNIGRSPRVPNTLMI